MIRRVSYTAGAAAMLAAGLFVFSVAAATDAFSATAEDNYKFYCAQCHGLTGEGNGPNATKDQPVSPRNHTNTKEMKKLSDQDIINVIKGGGAATSKSTLMPPFGKTLTEKEINDLKDYLRKLCKC